MAQTFDIPVDVPWTIVAASPDMIDTTFCDQGFPPPWRSSLAIYAYEPLATDLPPQLCNQTVTYLKITCSITGFQPTPEETSELSSGNVVVALPTVPGDAAEDLVSDYYACYGALLNVAVFPSTTTILQTTPAPEQYSFGPETRELPNPFVVPEPSLTFSLSRGPHLVIDQIPGDNAFGVLIEEAQLTIDLPVSTNVILSRDTREGARGTVTAYQRTAVVFTAPLATSEGVQDYVVNTSEQVTRVAINVEAGSCFLVGLSYDSMERPTTLGDYPTIIDFEPKTRDLYQTSTDQGEVLSGSKSGVTTGKSLSNSSSLEMGMSAAANVAANIGVLSVGASQSLTGSWGETSGDTSTTTADLSRERRETQGTTTNITQQYNILTGYHAGTNRAAFLMLPRPHTLQATDYRTFVRGLRMIEGIQEFFLVVSQPTTTPGICVEASLETGHFPETVTLGQPSGGGTTQSTTFQYTVLAYAPGGNVDAQYSNTVNGGSPQPAATTFTIPAPWVLDTTKGMPASPGVSWSIIPAAGDTTSSNEFVQADNSQNIQIATAPDEVTATVIVNSNGFDFTRRSESAAKAQVVFTIYATQPPSSDNGGDVVVSPFLVTTRDLCACLTSCGSNGCVKVLPTEQVPYGESTGSIGPSGYLPEATSGTGGRATTTPSASTPQMTASRSASLARSVGETAVKTSIVYEAKLRLPSHLLDPQLLQGSRTPAARELMYRIRQHMLGNWRLPQRRPRGTVGFVDSDYVTEHLAKRASAAQLGRKVSEIDGLSDETVRALGADTTVAELLRLDLHTLRTRSRTDVMAAVHIRRKLLGFIDPSSTPSPQDG